MANENNTTGAVNDMVDVIAKTAKQAADALTSGINSCVSLIEPTGKACVSVVSSLLDAVSKFYLSIAEALAPKK